MVDATPNGGAPIWGSFVRMADEEMESLPVHGDERVQASCPGRCMWGSLTFVTFLLVLISGLSLMTAGVFNDEIDHDQTNPGRPHLKLNLSALFGLLMVSYSIVGFCISCNNKLNGKVSPKYSKI